MQTAEAMQQRREDIVTAAQKLLAEEDLGAFSVRKLAKSAGVSVATIYNLIGDRQAVLFTIVSDLTQEMRRKQAGADGASNATSVVDAVERRLTNLLSFTKSRESLLRSANLAFDQLSRESDWVDSTTRIRKAAEASYVEDFSAGVAHGELRGDIPARVMSELTYGVYLIATMNWAYRRLSMNQYRKTVLRDALVVLLADTTESARPLVLERLARY